MVNAFTWDNGSERREFKSRKELYDHMVERGDVILEGDDAPMFARHVANSKSAKAAEAAKKLSDNLVG